jgi:hypothetical protein
MVSSEKSEFKMYKCHYCGWLRPSNCFLGEDGREYEDKNGHICLVCKEKGLGNPVLS